MTEENKPNWFVRILTIGFAVLLCCLVAAAFLKGNPSYALNSYIITVILIITAVILTEKFSHISIGKILSLSKSVEEKKSENTELKSENRELRKNLVKIATTVNQNQANTTINGIPFDVLGKLLGVTPVTKQEAEEKELEQKTEETQQTPEQKSDRTSRDKSMTRMEVMRLIEPKAIERYLSSQNLPSINLVREVGFSSSFVNIDPIMERSVVFDGYYPTQGVEYFFEVMRTSFLNPSKFDRIYVMLSKIWYYSQAKNIKAGLILILVDLPEEEFRTTGWKDRFIHYFQPAIVKGLLKLEETTISKEEYEEMEKNYLNEKSNQQNIFKP